LNDTSGTTAVDSISHIDGRLENGTALMDTGVLGTAARFDGSNDHILVPHNKALELEEVTVSFWFTADRLSGWQGLVSKDSLIGRNDGYLTIYTEYSRLKARCRSRWNSRAISTDSVLTTGQWYHVAVTFSESKVRLYLNGQLVDEGGYNGGLNGTTPMAFGAATWWSYGNDTTLTDFFQGSMDDVRVYDYGLSSAEITALYEEADQEDEQAPQLIADYTFEEVIYEPTLIMHFPLDETSGIVAQAAAVTSNNGNHFGQQRNDGRSRDRDPSNDRGGGQQQITQTVIDAVGALTGDCETAWTSTPRGTAPPPRSSTALTTTSSSPTTRPCCSTRAPSACGSTARSNGSTPACSARTQPTTTTAATCTSTSKTAASMSACNPRDRATNCGAAAWRTSNGTM
jgi:hypothetical protein